MKLKNHHMLYLRSMGKLLRITAIYDTAAAANRHIERPGNNDAVIAEFGKFIFLADKGDRGLQIEESGYAIHRPGRRSHSSLALDSRDIDEADHSNTGIKS